MNPVANYLGDLRSHWRRILVLLGWSTLQALPVFATGRLVTIAIDEGFLSGRPVLGLLVAALIPIFALVGAAAAHLVFRSLAEIVEPIRDAMVRRIVTEAVETVAADPRTARVSRSLARITRQTEAVRGVTAGVLVETASMAVTIVAVAAGLALLAGEVFALVVLPVVASLVLLVMALGRLMRRQDRVYRLEEELSVEVDHGVMAFRDIAAQGRGTHTADELAALAFRQAAFEVAVARAGTMRGLVVGVGGYFPLVLVLICAVPLLDRGLSPGELLGALTYVSTGLIPALRSFVGVAGDALPRLVTALRRSGSTQLTRPDMIELPRAAPCELLHGRAVLFESVTFAYGEGAPLFRGLDLAFAAGEHIAVVGPSGAGKSTLVDLMCGVREPTGGRVLVSGVPPRENRHVAVLPQEGYVFDATLRENLGYLAKGTVDDDEAARVIEALGAAALIDPVEGLDARVDPRSLSPGERQLISLVRLALSEASVVILDEATSHLSPAVDARIERLLHNQGRTLIVVAHRLDVVHRADRVVLVDTVGTKAGTHEKLLASSQVYRDLLGDSASAQDC